MKNIYLIIMFLFYKIGGKFASALKPISDRKSASVMRRQAEKIALGSSYVAHPYKRSFRVHLHNKPTIDANSKYFEFDTVEKELYSWWENSGYFKPSKDKAKRTFTVPMPPPNVTGSLHIGHALFVALQDIMARFHRMRGDATLWLPGTDHAGIATQLLVERALIEEGTSRRKIGRDAFLERVWAWKREKGGYITKQMRRLGASADWSREKFTLDPDMCEAVTKSFIDLYNRGLIYKGDYMVNWSPNLQTAVSDLEVDYEDEDGFLYHFKYILSDNNEDFIPVATTRPETIVGDSAVCVHPEDDRYKKFIGRTVRVPFMDRDIPVIADEYVEREFGTGALKVTPAHDANDYKLGKKYNLEMINIMNKDASMNENSGKYKDLDRFECRKKIWDDMDAAGIAIKKEPHKQRVPRSQRGGEIIEPMISSQWFLNVDNMAKKAIEAVRSKETQIIPERFEKVWYNWLENIHDWCISRQLWWGHQIPVYYINGDTNNFVVAKDEASAYEMARKDHGDAVVLTRDEDVLDTWFSSGLWPFATLGWPQADPKGDNDFNRFYPTSVLETGYDILFFWVARMVMMGIEFTGKSPFHTVYMHGLVRDGQGRKMSKTTGNVIDPIDTIENVGCDALRFSLVTGCTPGQDISLSLEKIESNRNFVNKMWNVGKYINGQVLNKLEGIDKSTLAVSKPMTVEDIDQMQLAEKYIISKCHDVCKQVTTDLDNYDFGPAGSKLYEFVWDEFADWYVEASKTRGKDTASMEKTARVLNYVWDCSLRLMHPFMPFITEALWQSIPHNDESLMISRWPQMEDEVLPVDESAISMFSDIQELIRSIRNARAEYDVQPGKKIGAHISCSLPELLNAIDQEKALLPLLARIDPSALILAPNSDGISVADNYVRLVVTESIDVYLPLSDMVDKEKEIKRLTKQAEKLQKDITGLETRLNSPGFTEKAPEHVVAEATGKLTDQRAQLEIIKKELESLTTVQS